MLFLLLPLLAAVFTGGSEVEFEEPISFHVIQISSFYNHSWVKHQGSGWLGELQTQCWNSSSDTIIFLYPWSRGNFSNKELKDLETYFRMYFMRVVQSVHAGLLQFEYLFEMQVIAGCEVHSGKAFIGFQHTAFQGLDFLRFQNDSWLPSPKGGKKAQTLCRLLNKNEHSTHITQKLLGDTCPRFTLGLLVACKTHPQRQVRPEAWLSSVPSPSPGHLQLICHVSGFHPKPVWVMWIRGEQVQLGTQQGDFLPNADGTWYLRATLDVAAGEAADLACRVKHSSLGGQDIILYWGVMVILALLIGLAIWIRKCWTYHGLPSSQGSSFEMRTQLPSFSS